jgi:hypothetical protein
MWKLQKAMRSEPVAQGANAVMREKTFEGGRKAVGILIAGRQLFLVFCLPSQLQHHGGEENRHCIRPLQLRRRLCGGHIAIVSDGRISRLA